MTRLLALLLGLLAMPATSLAEAPKVVGQAARISQFEAVAWTPDGRWLVEASGEERLVRIWDPRRGHVLDDIRLPLPERRETPDGSGALLAGREPGDLWASKVEVSADGLSARVEASFRPSQDPAYEWSRALDYEIDLVRRRASVREAKRTPVVPPEEGAERPPLPASPKGDLTLQADSNGVVVRNSEGEVTNIDFKWPAITNWAVISPDGAWLVFLSPVLDESKGQTRLVLLNLETGSNKSGAEWVYEGDYGRAAWVGDGRLLLSETSSPFDRERNWAKRGKPIVGRLIDPHTESTDRDREVAPRCYMQPLGSDRLIGAGLSSCRRGVAPDRNLWVSTLDGPWVVHPAKLPKGALIDGLRASADGSVVAVSVTEGERHALLVVDSHSGAIVHRRESDVPITAFNFLPDGRALVLMEVDQAVLWRLAEGRDDILPIMDFDPSMIASNGEDLLIGSSMGAVVQHVRLGEAEARPALEVQAPQTGGFVAGKPIAWIINGYGELTLFDSRDWTRLATVQRFVEVVDEGEETETEEETFLVHDAAGRYDSNLSPDYAPFRWLMADAPFQSLGPQTFMRQLYTPDLLSRLIACVPDRSCAKALPVAVNLSTLNRALPKVSDMEVRPGRVPGTVDVELTVSEGANPLPSAIYGRATSGMHNVRLFRDGVLVREAGAVDHGLDPADADGWRRTTLVKPNRPDGSYRAVFEGLALPSGLGTDHEVYFSAYAFNEDRVRGEEAEAFLKLAEAPELAKALAAPRPRRLFALSIGIDAYPGGTFGSLRYAVADARAMAGLFGRARIDEEGRPAMERVSIRIEGTAEKPATRAQIEAAFATLRQAGPDDVVVISFSGHGYTDAAGRFFLVPSDVQTAGDRPVAASMIGANDLARWLAPVDAGAIHMVIDACHSAASVLAGGFKPGPMGDPGLGQLAYDKGMNILSASAPDQFAMEESELGHGLLTYAFVVEGAERGKADVPDGDEMPDGLVTMDELMAFAVKALPDIEARNAGSEGPGLIVEWAGPMQRRQTPRLFDFAAEWSTLSVPVGAP